MCASLRLFKMSFISRLKRQKNESNREFVKYKNGNGTNCSSGQDLIIFQTVLSQFSLPFSYGQVAKRKTQMLVQW